MAISTESLNLLWLALSADKERVERALDELTGLSESSEYQAWHGSEPRAPFPITKSYPELESLGLIENGVLVVKVNRVGARIFLTDGAWFQNTMRVFPDPDEADVLLEYVKEKGLESWPSTIVDPASGSGHTPLGFRERRWCG